MSLPTHDAECWWGANVLNKCIENKDLIMNYNFMVVKAIDIHEERYHWHALYYGPVQFFIGLRDQLTDLV